jgi:hypothetical protein
MHGPLNVKKDTTIYSVVLIGDSITKIDLIYRFTSDLQWTEPCAICWAYAHMLRT